MFVRDLKEGDIIQEQELEVLVSSVFQGLTKKGDPYCNVKFRDHTGVLDCMFWDAKKEELHYKEGETYFVTGEIKSYQGTPQLSINRSTKTGNDPILFLPRIPEDEQEALIEKLNWYIEQTQSPYKDLLQELFGSENFTKSFYTTPAAKLYHNAIVGGLLRHTINVVEIASKMKPANSLVIAGSILHDVGKIQCFDVYSDFDYNAEGALLGHIVLAIPFLQKVINSLRKNKNVIFSKMDELLLLHCIVAHHGELELGSPIVPAIEEAMIIHAADEAACKMEMYQEEIEKVTPGKSEYSQGLKRFIFRQEKA